ncbi:tripartite tricarboxylate transporter substrate binding protein [Piscinibacter sp. XHJ-5]|uniref:Bug family tripartite tricarboxylate transporter substrate binding protein n=1 Tax=Piscinibacter sp. XHJ-5 TaxID=3037797 RepID=UPI00245367B1|nr:tripartite tricarboxylate transporter substrate binding protein [Piscinibacter sp. XHJ-5]
MKKLLSAVVLACVAAGGAQAQATAGSGQAWPSAKPITLVVPFPPGGSTDTVARAIGPKMQERLGQTVLTDNKPGATGTIAAGQVKRAAPDGYTLFVTSLGPLVIVPHLMKGLQYDPLHDFDPITIAVQAPNVLAVPASSPYKSVADVLAALKKDPGKVTFASSGNGSSDHLTAAVFWQQTGTTGIHVPYKGGGPVMQDLLGGQVDLSFQNINAVVPHVKSGKLRALAVTSKQRAATLPDVPTLAEAGVNGVDVYSWQAVLAPKGLPGDVRSKLHAAVVAALADPAVKKQFADLGFETVANTPEQFAAYQQQEYVRWKKVIEIGKITAE